VSGTPPSPPAGGPANPAQGPAQHPAHGPNPAQGPARPPASPPGPPAGRLSFAARTVRVLGLVGLVVVIGVAGLALVAAIAGETGDTGFVVGLILASVPVLPLVAAYVWLDRFEPEPPGQLLVLFLWGATVAALAAAILNSIGADLFAASAGQPGTSPPGTAPPGTREAGVAQAAVYVAPWVEEAAKGSIVVALALWRRREFNGVVDGMVAAGMVGIGFAFSENILYFGRAFLSTAAEFGTQAGLLAATATFVIRGVLAPFAHPLFTTAIGIGLGIAVHGRSWPVRVVAPLAGYLAAVAMHMMWNRYALTGLSGFVTGYLVMLVPLLAGMIVIAAVSRRTEGRLIARHLPAYAANGWLPAYDIPMLASMRRRRQAIAWMRSVAGSAAGRALHRYQLAATELAFLRDQLVRGFAVPDAPRRERELLADLRAQRARIPDPPGGSWDPPFTTGPVGSLRRRGLDD
jgi:RsiW-degrading membrane proteinase PrsW (M82 family)